MKKLLATIKQKTKVIIEKTKDSLYSLSIKVDKHYSKVMNYLTHNFVLNVTATDVILFKSLKIKITNKRRESIVGYLFISLWLIGFIIFMAYPLIYSLFLSFQQAFFNLETGIVTEFIGLKNLKDVLSDANLLPLFASYIGRIILSVPLIVVFAIVIAVLINQPIKGKGLFRTIFFLPVIISTGPVLGELINQGATNLPSLSNSAVTKSIINNLPNFIGTPVEALFSSMLLILWYAGIPVLIFLAGLQKIDKDIYEAASVDGASLWDSFWKITLPSIKPLISVTIIYIVVSMSLYVEPGGILDQAKIHMLQGSPTSASTWKGYGYASTIAWVYFILMVLLILIFIGLFSIHGRRRRN